MKTIIGIDGGRYGALAALYPDRTWEVHPVLVCGTDEVMLDVKGNYRLIEAIAAKAGGMDRIKVVYERCRKNPMFGYKNNFVNGRHDEFWRVLLGANSVTCEPVFPRTWQDTCLGRGGSLDTKERALSYVRSRCSNLVWLDMFTKVQREGVVDAMCIALHAAGGAAPTAPASAVLSAEVMASMAGHSSLASY